MHACITATSTDAARMHSPCAPSSQLRRARVIAGSCNEPHRHTHGHPCSPGPPPGHALCVRCAARRGGGVVAARCMCGACAVQIYSIWNFRREALGPVLAAGGEAARTAAAAELALTQACLMENPKSYSTWHQRKWIVAQGVADLTHELQLVSRCAQGVCASPIRLCGTKMWEMAWMTG